MRRATRDDDRTRRPSWARRTLRDVVDDDDASNDDDAHAHDAHASGGRRWVERRGWIHG